MSTSHARKLSVQFALRIVMLAVHLFLLPLSSWADDDDGFIPPFDPGPGFEVVSGGPDLPPGYVVDRGTIPRGIKSIYNIGDETGDIDLLTRQQFRPGLNAIDWVAFPFQNSEQLDDGDYEPGAGGGGLGRISISLWQFMDQTPGLSIGTLSGLLGTTDEQTIEEGTIEWLIFRFPDTIPLIPETDYFLSIDISEGFSVDVGGVGTNISSDFKPHTFWYHEFVGPSNPPQIFYDNFDEFLFAEGIVAVPEPSSVCLTIIGGFACFVIWCRRKTRRAAAMSPKHVLADGRHSVRAVRYTEGK